MLLPHHPQCVSPSRSGGIAASRCRRQMKRGRNFRSGRKTGGIAKPERFFGHRKVDRWQPPSHARRLTVEGEGHSHRAAKPRREASPSSPASRELPPLGEAQDAGGSTGRWGKLLPHHPLRGSFPRWGKHKTLGAAQAAGGSFSLITRFAGASPAGGSTGRRGKHKGCRRRHRNSFFFNAASFLPSRSNFISSSAMRLHFGEFTYVS